jgi:hypothetical protein
MTTRRISTETAAEAALARRLAALPRISALGEEEAWGLAHALLDVAQASRRISEELIPALSREGLPASELEALLHDIGEELRQIAYHVRHSRYYDYLGGDEA